MCASLPDGTAGQAPNPCPAAGRGRGHEGCLQATQKKAADMMMMHRDATPPDLIDLVLRLGPEDQCNAVRSPAAIRPPPSSAHRTRDPSWVLQAFFGHKEDRISARHRLPTDPRCRPHAMPPGWVLQVPCAQRRRGLLPRLACRRHGIVEQAGAFCSVRRTVYVNSTALLRKPQAIPLITAAEHRATPPPPMLNPHG